MQRLSIAQEALCTRGNKVNIDDIRKLLGQHSGLEESMTLWWRRHAAHHFRISLKPAARQVFEAALAETFADDTKINADFISATEVLSAEMVRASDEMTKILSERLMRVKEDQDAKDECPTTLDEFIEGLQVIRTKMSEAGELAARRWEKENEIRFAALLN